MTQQICKSFSLWNSTTDSKMYGPPCSPISIAPRSSKATLDSSFLTRRKLKKSPSESQQSLRRKRIQIKDWLKSSKSRTRLRRNRRRKKRRTLLWERLKVSSEATKRKKRQCPSQNQRISNIHRHSNSILPQEKLTLKTCLQSTLKSSKKPESPKKISKIRRWELKSLR